MIRRKSAVEHKQEKVQKPRKKRGKVDLSTLPDAIVDGKFIVPEKEKVFFERTLSGKTRVHEGTVTEVTEDGMVFIFDETVEQFYAFSLKQAVPNIKVGS